MMKSLLVILAVQMLAGFANAEEVQIYRCNIYLQQSGLIPSHQVDLAFWDTFVQERLAKSKIQAEMETVNDLAKKSEGTDNLSSISEVKSTSKQYKAYHVVGDKVSGVIQVDCFAKPVDQ
ncbi:MAG: hypothetical protein V4654_09055 [Bdellovibrionota bacterium]